MKVLVSSISQAAANRLKTPVIGSFILSWMAINHKILFTLFLSDNKERLTFLNELKFEWLSDIVLPIIVTLIYIFLVPAVQWLIDVVKFKFIDKKRTESQHSHLTSKYESLAEVSEKQSKSSLEYHNQRNLKDLEKWDSDRTTLLSENSQLKADCQHEKQLREESELSLSKVKNPHDLAFIADELNAQKIADLTLTLDAIYKNVNELKETTIEIHNNPVINELDQFQMESLGFSRDKKNQKLGKLTNALQNISIAKDIIKSKHHSISPSIVA